MLPEFTQIQLTVGGILSHPTWDIIVAFAVVSIGFFYGISAGKRRIAATILYTYISFILASAVPWQELIPRTKIEEGLFIKSGSFLVFLFLLSWLLGSKKTRGFAPASAWWQIFLLSFLQAGLLLHLILTFIPADYYKLLAPLTKNIFVNPNLHIWWLIAPLAVIIFLRRLEARKK